MTILLQDLRFALRQLRKSPGFTIVAILTLALGIGANAIVFCVMNALILRPLNVPQAESLYQLMRGKDKAGNHSFPDYLDLRDRNPVSYTHLTTSAQNNAETSPKTPPRCAVSRQCAESRWGRPTSLRNEGSRQCHGRGVGGALFQWSALLLWAGMSLALEEFTHVYTLQQERKLKRGI